MSASASASAFLASVKIVLGFGGEAEERSSWFVFFFKCSSPTEREERAQENETRYGRRARLARAVFDGRRISSPRRVLRIMIKYEFPPPMTYRGYVVSYDGENDYCLLLLIIINERLSAILVRKRGALWNDSNRSTPLHRSRLHPHPHKEN